MVSISQLSTTLQSLLTQGAKESAKESRYELRRAKKLPAEKFTQTMVFGAMDSPDLTLTHLTQTAAALGVEISPQGLDQRFSPQAATCLLGVLERSAAQAFSANAVPIELLERFSAVVVQDSSTVALPAEVAELYPGCGGRSGQGLAALKLHLSYDLRAGAVRVLLSSGRTADKASPLRDVPLQRGSLRLSDLGFFVLPHMAQLSKQGVFWLSRLLLHTGVFDQDGQHLELREFLPRHRGVALDMRVQLGGKQRVEARLLAVPVPAHVANERRRRYRLAARKKGQRPSARTLALCDWTILVTNIAPELLSIHEALVLQRARWQVELMFRLWKHHGRLDQWLTHKPWRILCELYAKLLAVLIEHWCALTCLWDKPDRSLVKAAALVRRYASMLASAFSGLLELQQALEKIRDALLKARCTMNKRRAKPNTYQLLLDPPALDVPILVLHRTEEDQPNAA